LDLSFKKSAQTKDAEDKDRKDANLPAHNRQRGSKDEEHLCVSRINHAAYHVAPDLLRIQNHPPHFVRNIMQHHLPRGALLARPVRHADLLARRDQGRVCGIQAADRHRDDSDCPVLLENNNAPVDFKNETRFDGIGKKKQDSETECLFKGKRDTGMEATLILCKYFYWYINNMLRAFDGQWTHCLVECVG
jgi:hypothetical protein